MAGPIAVDTPDYQRGIIHPQILLATVAAHTATVAVPLPPNTETLLVQCWGGVLDPRITVVGTTTHYEYPGQKTNSSAYAFASPTYLFDVSPALDEQVTVTFNTAPTSQWSVYADSGAHTVVDLGACRDANGVQFMVPTAPSSGNWDHPPVELSYLGAYLNATGDVLPAPGAGQRLRVFAAQMGAQTAGVVGGLRNGAAGEWFATCGVSGDSHAVFPLTGLPLPANQSVNYQLVAGAGFMMITVAYTTETI